MPESVTDRTTKTHEFIYLLTKNRTISDAYAIRSRTANEPLGGQKLKADGQSSWDEGTGHETYRDRTYAS
jgi:hypothetical protein